jgi:ElaB/YqjD/DUF883 family membrane-anchored ribosome-binding protein
MEKIEQQINLISTQIEALSSDIKTVESILEKDFKDWSQQDKRKYGNEEDEARKQLRSEKEQLRSEKEQLLEQKTILMKKEAEGMIRANVRRNQEQ